MQGKQIGNVFLTVLTTHTYILNIHYAGFLCLNWHYLIWW